MVLAGAQHDLVTLDARPAVLTETTYGSRGLCFATHSGYREMGFDKILLVEGPKDLKALQQILRMYGKDNKVLLLPLGGNSGNNADAEAQLAELQRISDNISAAIDSEKTSATDDLEPSREAFRQS